jgi:hypothetical protein
MSQSTAIEYLEKMRERYGRMTGKAAKSRIIEEVMEMTGYERKYTIRLLNGKRAGPAGAKRRGRRSEYGPEVEVVLRRIWKASEYLCGKRLKAAIPVWLESYEKRYGELSAEVRGKVLRISAAQIDRLLAPSKAQQRRRRNGGTKPGSLLKSQIPVRTHYEKLDGPGWLEADTVAHGGDSTSGDFIWSLTFTDVYSGWTENRAVWNKGQAGVVDAVAEVEEALPFALRGFDCDNGSEFLNWHLKAYLEAEHGGPEGRRRRRSFPVRFTRSRPYRKNDNCHVEQKNYTHVRQLLGYDRLDDPALVGKLNALYTEEWMHLHNFFMPCMKLVEKERDGGRTRRKYDQAQTPYQRLLASGKLNAKDKRRLQRVYEALDPFALQQGLEKKLREILKTVANANAPEPGDEPADRFLEQPSPPAALAGALGSPLAAPTAQGSLRTERPGESGSPCQGQSSSQTKSAKRTTRSKNTKK